MLACTSTDPQPYLRYQTRTVSAMIASSRSLSNVSVDVLSCLLTCPRSPKARSILQPCELFARRLHSALGPFLLQSRLHQRTA